MKLDISAPLNLNEQVTITIAATELSGRVIWVNGNDCGVAFDQPIDCAKLLSGQAASDELRRSPRLSTEISAKVTFEGGAYEAVVNDISVRGMNITNDSNFEPGLRVRVILENGCEKEGVVRWSKDNIAGVILLDPFSVEDLGSVQASSTDETT